jgi:hypothetical protein
MSETDSHYTPDANESFYDSESIGDNQYINERGDRYSDESSSYHISTHVDPNSTNKKCVRRYNPDLEKKVRVEFFPTNTNSLIKNAVSGTYQGTSGRYFRAGSRDEDLFFSVILATGELGPEPIVLFYDNPEQYEHHFFTKVKQEIKDKWTIKKDTALYNFKRQVKREEIELNGGVILVK